MRAFVFMLLVVAVTGCTTTGHDTEFTATLERAHAVNCDIKSLDWTERRTRLECFD